MGILWDYKDRWTVEGQTDGQGWLAHQVNPGSKIGTWQHVIAALDILNQQYINQCSIRNKIKEQIIQITNLCWTNELYNLENQGFKLLYHQVHKLQIKQLYNLF